MDLLSIKSTVYPDDTLRIIENEKDTETPVYVGIDDMYTSTSRGMSLTQDQVREVHETLGRVIDKWDYRKNGKVIPMFRMTKVFYPQGSIPMMNADTYFNRYGGYEIERFHDSETFIIPVKVLNLMVDLNLVKRLEHTFLKQETMLGDDLEIDHLFVSSVLDKYVRGGYDER